MVSDWSSIQVRPVCEILKFNYGIECVALRNHCIKSLNYYLYLLLSLNQ